MFSGEFGIGDALIIVQPKYLSSSFVSSIDEYFLYVGRCDVNYLCMPYMLFGRHWLFENVFLIGCYLKFGMQCLWECLSNEDCSFEFDLLNPLAPHQIKPGVGSELRNLVLWSETRVECAFGDDEQTLGLSLPCSEPSEDVCSQVPQNTPVPSHNPLSPHNKPPFFFFHFDDGYAVGFKANWAPLVYVHCNREIRDFQGSLELNYREDLGFNSQELRANYFSRRGVWSVSGWGPNLESMVSKSIRGPSREPE